MVESDPGYKHNKYVAYYKLKASPDTVFKYIYLAIQDNPIRECYLFQHNNPYPITVILGPGYYPKRVKEVCKFCDSIEKRLDSAMIRMMIVIDSNDLKYRASSDGVPWIKGNEEKWAKQHILDSTNQMLVAKMIEKKKKYIGLDIVGYELKDIAFFVIQHADLAYQEKYLPLVEQAIKEGNLYRSCYPLLIDRIYMRKGLPQIFGTQLVWNNKREVMELYRVQNLAEVNKLRKDYGLEPLSDYLKDNHAVIPDKVK
jgi:hypothetical protein